MASFLSRLILLALLRTAMSAWSCGDGWTGKTGTPSCSGADASTCSDSTCCTASPTPTPPTPPTTTCSHGFYCSWYSAGWITLSGCQSRNAGFFDLKKSTTCIGGEGTADDDIQAACCTPFADAKCGDWPLLCTGNYKYVKSTTSARGDDDGNIVGDFQDLCCADIATCSSHTCSSGWEKKSNVGNSRCTTDAASCTDQWCCQAIPTCNYYSASWVVKQISKEGCYDGGGFFDLKKATTQVGGTQTDTDIKSACCTPFSEATCNDWSTQVENYCPTAKPYVKLYTKATGSDNTISGNFQDLCCDVAMKCSEYTSSQDVDTAFSVAFPMVAAIAAVVMM